MTMLQDFREAKREMREALYRVSAEEIRAECARLEGSVQKGGDS